MTTIAQFCNDAIHRKLQPYPVLMTCGHTVYRLMSRDYGCKAGAPCEVCRGDMTQKDFDTFQECVRNHR
jgi:predicted transcriptional regulator